MQVISKTGNLSLLLGRTIRANQMIERGNLLYVRDSEKGIYVFDVYGNWVKTIPLNIASKIEVYNDLIYFLDNGKVFKYVQKDFLEYELNLDEEELEGFTFQSNRIFTQKKNQVRVHANPDKQ